MGSGGCCLMTGSVVLATAGSSVAVGLAVGVTTGLVGVPWDGEAAVGVAVGVAVAVAVTGTGAVLVSVALPARADTHWSPTSGCPAKAMVPQDRSR